MTQETMQKNTAAAEAESTLVENVAQETEGRSKKRSSKDDNKRDTAAASEAGSTNGDTAMHETEGSTTMRSSEADDPRGGSAHLEHRRPDGWTSTPRGKDEEKNCGKHVDTSSQPLVRTGGEGAHDNIKFIGCGSSCDLRAGERPPKQRPLGDEHPERSPEEHLGAQKFPQVEEAGSIVLQFSRSLSVFKNESKETQETTSAAAKKKDECVDKDSENPETHRREEKDAQRRKTSIEGAEQKKKYQRKKQNEKTSRH